MSLCLAARVPKTKGTVALTLRGGFRHLILEDNLDLCALRAGRRSATGLKGPLQVAMCQRIGRSSLVPVILWLNLPR